MRGAIQLCLIPIPKTTRVPTTNSSRKNSSHKIATARRLIDDLIDADIVTPVPEDRVLVHEPSGTTFDSTTQLAVFHRGWTAGRDADAEGE